MKSISNTLAMAALLGIGPMLFSTQAAAAGKLCKLEIAGDDKMQFDKKELAVAADCTEVELTLKHTGKLPAQQMGHNWVLMKAADVTAVSTAGMTAGLDKNYLPPGDKRVLAATKVIGGGQSTSMKFSTSVLKKGESYAYVCTFPGHYTIMRGTFKFG